MAAETVVTTDVVAETAGIRHPNDANADLGDAIENGDIEPGDAGDLGPEGLLFVPAEDAPKKMPILIVGNEISGTTTLYEVGV